MKALRLLFAPFVVAWSILAAGVTVNTVAAPAPAEAQSNCPYIAYGAVLTAGQWNTCFSSKQDYATGIIHGPNSVTAGDMACWSNFLLLTDCGAIPQVLAGAGIAVAPSAHNFTVSLAASPSLTGQALISGATTTSPGWYTQITGDAIPRVRVGLNASDEASIAFGGGAGVRDAFLERLAAGSLRFGTDDAASPVAQSLSVQNVAAGNSNVAGANWTFNGSQGTGTGIGGSLIFRTAPAGSTGTAPNAEATALTIDSTQTATFAQVPALPSQAANKLFASPNGSSGAPSFRSIVPTDATGSTNGSGNFALTTSPTFVTPTLGVAAATSLSYPSGTKVTDTANGTLSIANSGATNTLTIAAGGSGLADFGGSVRLPSGSNLSWVNRTQVFSGVDGQLTVANNAATNSFTMTASGNGGATFTGAVKSATVLGFSGGAAWAVSGTNAMNLQNSTGAVSVNFYVPNNNELRLGGVDSGGPAAQTISTQNVSTGTANGQGQNLTVAAGQGTGNAAGGTLNFNVSPAGSSGSTQNALVTALSVDSTKTATFNGPIAGTGGNLTLGTAYSYLFSSRGGFTSLGDGSFRLTNSAGSNTVNLMVPASNEFRLGTFDAASPAAQTMSVQNVVAGTSNTAGVNWTFNGSRGTGTGAGGSIIFQTAPAGSTGTAQNAFISNLQFNSNGLLQFGGTTSSLSALKGSGTQLQVRLADDSTYGAFAAGNTQLFGSLAMINSGAVGLGASGQINWSSSTILATPPGNGTFLWTKAAGGQLTVSTLPSCTSGNDGTRAFVTDATVTTFASAVAGSGSNHVPVYCDGSGTPTWKIGQNDLHPVNDNGPDADRLSAFG